MDGLMRVRRVTPKYGRCPYDSILLEYEQKRMTGRVRGSRSFQSSLARVRAEGARPSFVRLKYVVSDMAPFIARSPHIIAHVFIRSDLLLGSKDRRRTCP